MDVPAANIAPGVDIAPTRVTGGTNSPGIGPAPFAMPPGMAIRYDRPAADLADSITGYHVYSTDRRHTGQVDWFLPGTANVRIAIDAGPITVSIGARLFDPVPAVSLFGPTSQALQATTNGGAMIGFGVSALGWSRLFADPAAAVRDRIVPLAERLPDLAATLQARLDASDRGAGVAPILDTLLRETLRPQHRDAPTIRQVMALIARDGPVEVAQAAAELGLEQHALRRLSLRHFGFPAKLLLRRARFLRSFLRVCSPDGTVDYARLDDSYFDVPHFLRDANTFLGMTPRRFLGLNTPFLDASLRARAAVLGAPTQVLHDIAAGQGD